MVRKLDAKGRDVILKEELMVAKTNKDGKEEQVPVASLVFRYDGKDYVFKRGEKKTVPFTLNPADLALLDENDEWTVEPGDFEVIVGGLKKTFSVKSPAPARRSN